MCRQVTSLRSALEQLLADPQLRRRMGEAARERVRERFSWDAVTDATIAAYRETSGERA
jgi:starch synthase